MTGKSFSFTSMGYRIPKEVILPWLNEIVGQKDPNIMRKKILVVDDNRVMLTFLSSLLEKEGHLVQTAEDGLSALSMLTTFTPDIVFIDLIIPKIGGDKLCQIIRTMQHLRNCYVVIVSAAVAEMKIDFEKIGVNKCIAKGPFDQMAKHVVEAIEDADAPQREMAAKQIIGLRSVDGIPVYARRMTRELLSQNRHLETILESMAEGILEVYSGKIVYANSAAGTLFGVPQEKLLACYLPDLFDSTLRSIIEKLLPSAPGVKTKVKQGLPVNLKGRQVVIESLPVKGEEPSTIILLITDVTERMNLEMQLQHAKRMDAIGSLAGGIAHNFNNILMGVQGNVSIMLQEKDAGSQDFEELKSIERCVESGAKLTKQLLRFARGGRFSVETININEIVDKSAGMFGSTRREIRIQKNLLQDIWPVEVDPGQIELVLMDLYVNALHAMPNGGELFLRTENVVLDEAQTRPDDANPGPYVKITITDTGVGMDEETRQRIFEPFYTTKDIGEGTGLGLSSAFGIIKGHFGFIRVNSEIGKGSSFQIYLPVVEMVPAESKVVKRDALVSDKLFKGGGTILVVDDEDIIVEVDRAMLENLGYEVLTAKGGREGIRLFDEHKEKIKLLILDVVMPDVDGGQVFDYIKSLKPEVKVILSSGYHLNGQANDIFRRGCNGFIQKPFSISQLSRKIREVMETAYVEG